jgi:hypothetical protein
VAAEAVRGPVFDKGALAPGVQRTDGFSDVPVQAADGLDRSTISASSWRCVHQPSPLCGRRRAGPSLRPCTRATPDPARACSQLRHGWNARARRLRRHRCLGRGALRHGRPLPRAARRRSRGLVPHPSIRFHRLWVQACDAGAARTVWSRSTHAVTSGWWQRRWRQPERRGRIEDVSARAFRP